MLTRPLSNEAEAFPSATYLTAFLGGLLPRTCGFLTSTGRHGFRIDPELDAEIKRMYSNKHRASSATLRNSLAEPILMDNPFLELPLLLSPISPIDNPGISALTMSQISPMREISTKEHGSKIEKEEASQKLEEYIPKSMNELEEVDNSTISDIEDSSNSTVFGTRDNGELKMTPNSRAVTNEPDEEYLAVARILTGNYTTPPQKELIPQHLKKEKKVLSILLINPRSCHLTKWKLANPTKFTPWPARMLKVGC
ncbi:unnamed protein product [Cylicostephanus goldi]|uniref:Uncharacterized protein n=1 Tax=Cylicostephanus goldi TaxID=71465 RepID=A0A3P6V178_CYLGO|nr:unnamed protein product [Cylicostephanus goldi]